MTVDITNVKYTTLDRDRTFRFDFIQMSPGVWHIYIIDPVDYNGRPQSSVQSHRLTDARGSYICWAPAPRTLDDAKGVARAWADATHEYIRTGVFPAPGPTRFVPDISTSATWQHRNNSGTIPPAPPAPPPRLQPASPTPAPSMQVQASPRRGLRGLFSTRRNP